MRNIYIVTATQGVFPDMTPAPVAPEAEGGDE